MYVLDKVTAGNGVTPTVHPPRGEARILALPQLKSVHRPEKTVGPPSIPSVLSGQTLAVPSERTTRPLTPTYRPDIVGDGTYLRGSRRLQAAQTSKEQTWNRDDHCGNAQPPLETGEWKKAVGTSAGSLSHLRTAARVMTSIALNFPSVTLPSTSEW